MRISALIMTALLVVIYLTSCTKTPTRVYFTRYNNPAIDQYTFQPGTYWIYRDSLSGVEDSIVVTSQYSDTIVMNQQRQFAEQSHMSLTHYTNNYTYSGSFFVGYDYISFYDGYSSQIESSLATTTTTDATIMGVYYTGLKKVGYSYAQMWLKEGIGPLQYTTYNYSGSGNYAVKQLVRYHIVQ